MTPYQNKNLIFFKDYLINSHKNFNKLFLLILFFISLLIIDQAKAADGFKQNITIQSGDTLTITDGQYTNNLTVNSGGKLIIDNSGSLYINSDDPGTISNSGDIIANGRFGLNQNVNILKNTGTVQIKSNVGSDFIRITSNQFNQLLNSTEGKFILGGDEINYPVRLQLSDNSDINLTSINNDTGSFKSDKGGIFEIKKWGRLRTSRTQLFLYGNELKIGNISYSSSLEPVNEGTDITDSELPTIRGSNITLEKDKTDTQIKLSSGILMSGSDLDPNVQDNTRLSTLNIGKVNNGIYRSTLILDGGVVALGSGGNSQGGGTVNGNIIIGDTSSTQTGLLFVRAGQYAINGNVTLNKNGILRVGGGYSGEGELFQTELMIKNKFLSLDGVLEIIGGAKLNAEDGIEGSKDTVWDVPTGELIASKLTMNGGQINFDPPFVADGDTSNASMGGLSFASDNIDARINIGRNSMVTLGSDNPEWLRTKINEYQTKNQLLWGRDITSALAIRSPQTLSPLGGLNVDGNWTNNDTPATEGTARFADKSLFVVDAAGTKGATALSGSGTETLKVESGAKLLVTDAATGDEIKITGNFSSSEISEYGWKTNTTTSTELQYAEGEVVNPNTGEYIVRITDGKTPAEAFPALSSELNTVVAKARQNGLDTNSPDGGTRFISRAVDNRYIGANDTQLAASTMESAARMAIVGAVPQMTIAANNAAGAAITQRTSFAQPDGILQGITQDGEHIQDRGIHANSFALWIMPLYQSTNGFGMEAGNFNYDFNGALGGVAIGADYTFDNMFRLGMSFNIGGGYAQGSGDLNKTTNNMSFWGIGAYAGWTQNNFGLIADINYTSTYNKLKQELPEQMQMDNLKGDVTAWAIGTGLRAEYKIETSYLDLVPHAGFRFTNIHTDSYDINSNGTILNGESFSQNIWTFPIGLTLTKEFKLNNGWDITPILDLNITPAAGDFNAKSKINFTGIDQEAELETKMMDYVTYGGTAGIKFGNETVSLGINYNGQFGANSSAHGVFGTLRFEF